MGGLGLNFCFLHERGENKEEQQEGETESEKAFCSLGDGGLLAQRCLGGTTQKGNLPMQRLPLTVLGIPLVVNEWQERLLGKIGLITCHHVFFW